MFLLIFCLLSLSFCSFAVIIDAVQPEAPQRYFQQRAQGADLIDPGLTRSLVTNVVIELAPHARAHTGRGARTDIPQPRGPTSASQSSETRRLRSPIAAGRVAAE